MNRLSEVVAHTGATGPAGQHAGGRGRVAGLRDAGDQVGLLGERRRSLRGLLEGLPTLPPITLDARVTRESDGTAPLVPRIEADPSGGAVVETVVVIALGGQVVPDLDLNGLLNGRELVGGVFDGQTFGAPGRYDATVRRTGVTAAGVTTLEKRLTFTVRAAPVPTPPRPPSPPAPAPGPSCQVGLDLDDPGQGAVVGMRATGGGFVSGEVVDIVENGVVQASTPSNVLGMYSVHVGYLRGPDPIPHVVRAVGETSGLMSNTVSFTV